MTTLNKEAKAKLFENLRRFRFQKQKVISSDNFSNDSNGDSKKLKARTSSIEISSENDFSNDESSRQLNLVNGDDTKRSGPKLSTPAVHEISDSETDDASSKQNNSSVRPKDSLSPFKTEDSLSPSKSSSSSAQKSHNSSSASSTTSSPYKSSHHSSSSSRSSHHSHSSHKHSSHSHKSHSSSSHSHKSSSTKHVKSSERSHHSTHRKESVTLHEISDSDPDDSKAFKSKPSSISGSKSRISSHHHKTKTHDHRHHSNTNSNSEHFANGSSQSSTKSKKSRIINRATLEESSDDEEEKEHESKYSRIKSSSNIKKRKRIKTPSSSDDSDDSRPSKKNKTNSSSKLKPGKQTKDNACSSDEEYWDETVLDDDGDFSSDDEVEISDEMTPSKVKIFDFLNNAAEEELLMIASCTEKRVKTIVENRPYLGWKDVIFKFRSIKHLNVQILDLMLEFFKRKSIVSKLMNRCFNLAISTEKAIVEGATRLKSQPSILTPSLQLKSYQMVGLNWLAVMNSQNLNGILADEMGLGKTIQVISFLAHLKEAGLATAPHLVIAPSSTIDNWAIEFTRWCPSLRVVIYHGSTEERRSLRAQWFKEKFSSMDIIITTYRVVCSNKDERKMFRIIHLQYVIFDEAHMLKNMNTQRYFHLYSINARSTILLTGTPLQNNLLELMSLLNFIMPNMFSDKLEYIKAFFSKNTKGDTDVVSAFEQEQVDLAKRIMKPFVLRRLKTDVLKDLPSKTSSVIKCPLASDQQTKYTELVEMIAQSAKNEDPAYNFMSSFMQLRKLANHPLTHRFIYKEDLLTEMADRLSYDESYKETNKQYILDDLSALSDHAIHQLTLDHKCISKFKLKDSQIVESGKFLEFDRLLPKLKDEGHRICVFSQFVFMLDLIEDYMRIREHSFVRLDGTTNILDRQELIDEFNEDMDIFAFLLSTKAGGVGINLTSADTVILHDIDYNPYNDKQAEDRCHRLGQTKPVQIIRLISENTVEEKIYASAQSKLELEQELIGQENESDETKNVEDLLKEALGIVKK